MRLSDLSLKEKLLLARRAELRCVECLVALSGRIDPSDPDLARRLREMASEEEGHAADLSRFDAGVSWPLVWRLDERAIDRLLGSHLPALRGGPGEAPADPAGALRKTEAIEEEAVLFYRALAAETPEPEPRALFEDLAAREAAHHPGGNDR